MADTVRSKVDLLGRFQPSSNITKQTLRDLVVSVFGDYAAIWSPHTTYKTLSLTTSLAEADPVPWASSEGQDLSISDTIQITSPSSEVRRFQYTTSGIYIVSLVTSLYFTTTDRVSLYLRWTSDGSSWMTIASAALKPSTTDQYIPVHLMGCVKCWANCEIGFFANSDVTMDVGLRDGALLTWRVG